jgi:hypothetical protein
MGLIEKIKLLFKARQPVTDIINQVKEVKAGWKTLPFWITLLGSAGALVAALQGFIPATAALVATTVLTGFYNILRGATKTDVASTKPVLQTTEFWLGVLGTIGSAIVSLQAGGINPAWFATASTVIGAAMAAGQNLAAQTPSTPAQVAAAPATPPAK